ncbi:MAG: glycosyltransferase [Roseburia sp.]
MRIAMLTNNYKPYVGGVPISIEHLAAALRELGHTVYIFAPSYENQVEEEYVIRYPSFPLKIAGAPVPNVLTKLFIKKMVELQIDIIHVHHPAIVGNVALNIRRKLGIPVVFTYHTRYEEYLHYIKPLQQVESRTGIIEGYLHHFCNQCDRIVAPTPGIEAYLREKNINVPIGVMPTGIPEESFHPQPERVAAIRWQYGQGVDYLFCTVSRLAEEKNLDFQLEGLVQLKKLLAARGKKFRHLIIGDGPKHEALERRLGELDLAENVVLLGNVDNGEIRNYQAASQLFLFTSKSETQGIVLLEAMAAGNPVVAVEASGVRDIVKNGENGFMTEEDSLLWAKQAAELLQEKATYRRLCEGAKRTAEAYSENRIAELAEYYYEDTCARASEKLEKTFFFHKYV